MWFPAFGFTCCFSARFNCIIPSMQAPYSMLQGACMMLAH